MTKEVLIYGASDDLIEVEFDDGRGDEYSAYGGGDVLVIGPTLEVVEVIVRMDDDGDWYAHPKIKRGAMIGHEMVSRPNRPDGSLDTGVKLSFQATDDYQSIFTYFIGGVSE